MATAPSQYVPSPASWRLQGTGPQERAPNARPSATLPRPSRSLAEERASSGVWLSGGRVKGNQVMLSKRTVGTTTAALWTWSSPVCSVSLGRKSQINEAPAFKGANQEAQN